ncbi:hypothetical protein M4I21_01480 [Cellulophaga sp. 20_2_10]|uniref:hypothetical protein n=1 Tax=Cellulophaga sp. 20_2_10 TaxID=2942476 RepID=UPI00201A91EE|nr:hypothetical protein [Cellulophaga sp. 20_2_10]MCL5244460.1 hypothetical protein [Cellulophaga sp. 20_2_10]
MKALKYINLLIIVITFSAYSQVSDKGIITIDTSSYGSYPAVFVDLSSGSLLKLDANLKEIDADLWIEPNDPEINGLEESFDGGITHSGENVLLRILEKGEHEADIKKMFPNTFVDSVDRGKIKTGLQFIVHTSENLFYVIKISSFSKEDEEMTLEYQKI